MKKLLIILMLAAACGPKPDRPTDSVAPPEIREDNNGGVFITPEPGDPEEVCFIEYFEYEKGPYGVEGLIFQGPYQNFARDKEIVTEAEGDYIHLVDATLESTNVPFERFTKWGEVWVGDDLIGWMEDPPKGALTVTPNMDGSINLAKYGKSFTATGVLRARFPPKATDVSFSLKFRRLYNCREKL